MHEMIRTWHQAAIYWKKHTVVLWGCYNAQTGWSEEQLNHV